MPKPPKIHGSPLTPHASGQYCKKILGKVYYFGTDHEAALDLYRRQSAELHAGRTPISAPEGMLLADVVNRYLDLRLADVRDEKLSPRTWADYEDAGKLLVNTLGGWRSAATLVPDDFNKIAEAIAYMAPVSRARYITCVRVILRQSADDGVIPHPRFGTKFRAKVAKERRLAKAKAGPQLLTPEHLRQALAKAQPVLRAMVYLGINCAFGPNDCALLTRSSLRLNDKVPTHTFPRPKTGTARLCVLWPETVKALKAVIGKRPEPADPADDDLVFLTRRGQRFVRADTSAHFNQIALNWSRLRSRINAKLKLKDPHRFPARGFYALRKTFRTVADDMPGADQHAIHLIMGHVLPGMSDVYVERISVERVQAVTDHVRAWLNPAAVHRGSKQTV